MGSSWHGATRLARRHSHSNGATRRFVGNKVPWTEVKSQNRMTRAVVNSGKCKTRKNPTHKTAGSKLHVERVRALTRIYDFFCVFPLKLSAS